MLLNMDFNASTLGRHPKRDRNGQLVDNAQPVAGAVLCSLSARHVTAPELIHLQLVPLPNDVFTVQVWPPSFTANRASAPNVVSPLVTCRRVLLAPIHTLGEHNVND